MVDVPTIEDLSSVVVSMSNRIDALETRMTTLESRMTTLETKVGNIETAIQVPQNVKDALLVINTWLSTK